MVVLYYIHDYHYIADGPMLMQRRRVLSFPLAAHATRSAHMSPMAAAGAASSAASFAADSAAAIVVSVVLLASERRRATAAVAACVAAVSYALSFCGSSAADFANFTRPLLSFSLILSCSESSASMNTASKLGPHTQTDRGTCPGVGL